MSTKKTPKKTPSTRKSPLQLVQDFGGKAKLLEAVEAFTTEELWVGRTSKDRGGKKSLARVSNAKLLRLHAIFGEVKKAFGTRDKLIGSILELENRTKDEGYKKRLGEHPVPRLYDHYKSAKKRAGATAEKK
ncbi:MAG: hypothetical protein IPM79_29425 [Polyangiaceae bacterium]|jgi:hypothetical protein|nr:hypothetical protein [Polyangiaceae bacterium]MBK8941614.1 hypothetical protein [Polyangiaceae bacterium]